MHSYPRIRRITAEQLYIKLVEQGGMNDRHQVAVDLLLNSPWDGDDSTADISSLALQVASALGVANLMELPQI